jgi:hypothetical protein
VSLSFPVGLVAAPAMARVDHCRCPNEATNAARLLDPVECLAGPHERNFLMSRTILVITIVTWWLTGAAPAQEPKFERFTSEEGRFAVEMPGKPTATSQKTKDGLVIHYFTVQEFVERSTVAYIDYASGSFRGKDPQQVLKLFSSGQYANKKLEEEKQIAFGDDKVPGLEYRVATEVETDEGGKVPIFLRERLLLDGDRLYVIQYRAAVNKNLLNSKEANHLFDSFTLTK